MWLMIVFVIVLNAVFLLMPKNLTSIELFAICMFAMVFQQIIGYIPQARSSGLSSAVPYLPSLRHPH
ncbi:hypothetical protein PCCS19_07940 [Paenibacillus sp. CCS19]|uniref:hypothetical protein n=1 Tax=Paenibacillus sp. CCS19 TaxID=3158387 RepID=UPI002569B985|nr:hypothetical protein [Paenibacillus cellulosilyticus]GMK37740.1 hypothetical protein PCCS19_07940 [Paenibacillus cellulosilyticus]